MTIEMLAKKISKVRFHKGRRNVFNTLRCVSLNSFSLLSLRALRYAFMRWILSSSACGGSVLLTPACK